MIPVLVTLNVLAAVLPAAGIVRLLMRARRSLHRLQRLAAERGHENQTVEDFNEDWGRSLTDSARHEVRDLWADVALVGGGLALGAVANIWGLFLQR